MRGAKEACEKFSLVTSLLLITAQEQADCVHAVANEVPLPELLVGSLEPLGDLDSSR